MLEELLVGNLGIIEDAHLELGQGLVVVTGETGTGKTMLLGALRLLLGGAARRDLVGPSGDEATVQARFALDGEDVLVARRLSKQGRSKAYLDGIMAPLKALEERTAGVVELVAQHDHLRLTQTSEVRRMLDATLDAKGRTALTAYQEAWTTLRELEARRAELGGDRRALERELEIARHQADEIDAAGFEPGDDQALAIKAARLRNAQAIIESLDQAATDLGPEMIESAMDRAVIALTRAAGLDASLQPLLDQAVEIATLLAEVGGDIGRVAADVAAEPDELDTIESQLALLGDLRRKYGATLDEVLSFGAEAATRAGALHSLLDESVDLDSRIAAAEASVTAAGEVLGSTRVAAGERIAAEAVGHLRDLGFSDPTVEFHFAEVPPGASGTQRVQLMFASDRQLDAGPVARIASGGELSRLVLALRLAADTGDAVVAAFDEIDAGVGGAVALELGKKLAGLATQRQVLCVTHLPQIAAFASTHFVVERVDGRASVRRVDGVERLEELSRMLAGMPESELGREHAAELLAAAAAAAAGD